MATDPDSSRMTACLMVENSNPGADSKQGESTSEKEKEEEGDIGALEKGGVYPSLYRPRGVPSSSPPPCGTKLPRGGSAPAKGGGGPHPWRQAQGGSPPPPLMGPMGPFSLFPIF